MDISRVSGFKKNAAAKSAKRNERDKKRKSMETSGAGEEGDGAVEGDADEPEDVEADVDRGAADEDADAA
tara:strand:+ start:1639 stop:1848 length:210 start_codon:yes stop_codon:yes gene_type:complete